MDQHDGSTQAQVGPYYRVMFTTRHDSVGWTSFRLLARNGWWYSATWRDDGTKTVRTLAGLEVNGVYQHVADEVNQVCQAYVDGGAFAADIAEQKAVSS